MRPETRACSCSPYCPAARKVFPVCTTLAKSETDFNGYELWRKPHAEFEPEVDGKSLRWRRQLLHPAFPPKEADFAVALLDWESDVSRYEAEFAKTIDEEDKRAVLLEVAPTALKQHLAQNSASLVNYVILRQTIVGYLQAKNVWTSGRGEGNLYGAAASVLKKPTRDPNAMQIDAFNSKGKGKGDGKGKGKGDWNKGQTQWQEQRKGKGDEKGKGKGKDDAHKGQKGKYGDGPKEQCGICWNRGHAAADCWYKGKGKGGTKGKVHEFSAEPDAPSLASLAAPASSVGTSASVTARNVSCISAAKSSTINSLTRVTTELRPQPRYVMMIRGEATADTSAAQPLVAGSPAPAPSYLNSMDDERDELTVQDALPVKPKVCGIGARPDLRGRLLIDSGACESVVRPHVFEQYVDPTKACKLYAVNDSEIHVDGSQAALMKFRTAAGNSELGQVNFSVTSYTMEDILSVCKQMEAGYDVHFCRTGCFIDNDAGDKLLFYREGDRFYLDFEHLSDAELEQHHETRLMAPISSDNSIAMRLAEEAEPADDGWNHMEPFDQEAEEAHEEFDAGALDDEMTLEELRAQVALPQEPQGIKVPQEPTPAERERRNLLHLDMAPWCETCVAAKGREAHHVRDKDPGDPITPLVQIDYMFMSRDGTLVEDESRLVTMLTGIAASSGWLLAVMVPQKGTGGGKDYAVRALELFLTGLGEPLIMLQYDGKNPIRVLAQAVQKRLGSDKIQLR
ncbi:unnamed protein product [Polarella glacialis]|uniref:Uncharacterized protein n=1 Tax=Polarella glacialis TaxID=89957 RepID=A0A813JJC5_POLGL|nr:unnamed protein product [Polarella glacialis]